MTLNEKEKKKLDGLMDEQMDIEFEIFDKIDALIIAKWNAPKLQTEIEQHIKDRKKIYIETGPLFEKDEADDK